MMVKISKIHSELEELSRQIASVYYGLDIVIPRLPVESLNSHYMLKEKLDVYFQSLIELPQIELNTSIQEFFELPRININSHG